MRSHLTLHYTQQNVQPAGGAYNSGYIRATIGVTRAKSLNLTVL